MKKKSMVKNMGWLISAFMVSIIIVSSIIVTVLYNDRKIVKDVVETEENNHDYIICRSGSEEAYYGEKFVGNEYFDGFSGFSDGKYWICE